MSGNSKTENEKAQTSEWKTSPFKTLNITSLVAATKKKAREAIVIAERIASEPSLPSEEDAVHIVDRTLDTPSENDYNSNPRNEIAKLSPINGLGSSYSPDGLKNALQQFNESVPPNSGRVNKNESG